MKKGNILRQKPFEEMTAEELREYAADQEHENELRAKDQIHLLGLVKSLQAQIAEFEERTQSLSEKLATSRETIEWGDKFFNARIAAMEEFHEKEIAELKAELETESKRRSEAEKSAMEWRVACMYWSDRFDKLTEENAG